MDIQNDWIFKKTAFVVVPLPAFEHELFSVYIEIKNEILCFKSTRYIIGSKNVERQVINLSPGIFLCPF